MMTGAAHVKITVMCDTGHVIGTWDDVIEDQKYPFHCGECGEDKRMVKYPWTLHTEIVSVGEGDEGEPTIADVFDAVEDLTIAMQGLVQRQMAVEAIWDEAVRFGKAAHAAGRELERKKSAELKSTVQSPKVPDTRRVDLAAVCEDQADEHDEDQADEPRPDEEDR